MSITAYDRRSSAGPDVYAVAAHDVLNRVGAAWLQARRLQAELAPEGHPASATAELIVRNLGAAIASLEGLARGWV